MSQISGLSLCLSNRTLALFQQTVQVVNEGLDLIGIGTFNRLAVAVPHFD